MQARPFLKWVGGKTQLLNQILPLLPETFRNYYEPFVGGGALFFALTARDCFERAFLSDRNVELVDAYRAVREHSSELKCALKSLPYNRETFDALKGQLPSDLGRVERAARTIYLNKTGFNGLYRVNKAGRFNVAFGSFKTPPNIVDEENLDACSTALAARAVVQCTDFAEAVKDADAGDVVYFDPPYVPVTATASFRAYTSAGFDAADHSRLAACFKHLAARGVRVIASNSDTTLVRSLYEGFRMVEVPARRSINSKGDRRGPVGELLIIGG